MSRGRLGHITDLEVQRKEGKHVSAIVDQKRRQDPLNGMKGRPLRWLIIGDSSCTMALKLDEYEDLSLFKHLLVP